MSWPSSVVQQFLYNEMNLLSSKTINGMVEVLVIEYESNNWKLFIGSSTPSLRGSLLHNDNSESSVSVCYALHMKETYENKKCRVKMHKIWWTKVAALWCLKGCCSCDGLQSTYTKYCCYLYEWDSSAREIGQLTSHWSLGFIIYLVFNSHFSLDQVKILLPLLHIQLGIMDNVLNAMEKIGQRFKYLTLNLPWHSDVKVKTGISIGSQIRELLKNWEFESLIHEKEKAAWEEF